MKIQNPFSAEILIDSRKSIFYLLCAAVYRTANSGKMEPKYLTKKLMLFKFQISRERRTIKIKDSNVLCLQQQIYFYGKTRIYCRILDIWLLVFMLSQPIAELCNGLIDLDYDFQAVQGFKGLLTNKFCHARQVLSIKQQKIPYPTPVLNEWAISRQIRIPTK